MHTHSHTHVHSHGDTKIGTHTHKHSGTHTHTPHWPGGGERCGMFVLAVYANKFLIGVEGHMISSKKHQSFLCFITFYVQIKTWSWAGAQPANPICLLTSEGGSRGSDVVKDSIVNSPCQ